MKHSSAVSNLKLVVCRTGETGKDLVGLAQIFLKVPHTSEVAGADEKLSSKQYSISNTKMKRMKLR